MTNTNNAGARRQLFNLNQDKELIFSMMVQHLFSYSGTFGAWSRIHFSCLTIGNGILMGCWLISPCKKLATISQTLFSEAFSWMKYLAPKSDKPLSDLNQCWPDSLTHIRGSMGGGGVAGGWGGWVLCWGVGAGVVSNLEILLTRPPKATA